MRGRHAKASEMQAVAKQVETYRKTGDQAKPMSMKLSPPRPYRPFSPEQRGFGTQKGGWSVTYRADKYPLHRDFKSHVLHSEHEHTYSILVYQRNAIALSLGSAEA